MRIILEECLSNQTSFVAVNRKGFKVLSNVYIWGRRVDTPLPNCWPPCFLLMFAYLNNVDVHLLTISLLTMTDEIKIKKKNHEHLSRIRLKILIYEGYHINSVNRIGHSRFFFLYIILLILKLFLPP